MNESPTISVEELLRSVAGSSEIVTVVYNGGSHPGQARKTVPLSVGDGNVILAEDGADFHKSYKLSTIASVELSSGKRAENRDATRDPEPSAPAMETLSQYAEFFGSELRAAGWNVISTDEQLAVGGYFKNGKPRRSMLVSIAYHEPALNQCGRFRADPRRLQRGRQFRAYRLVPTETTPNLCHHRAAPRPLCR